MKCESCNKKYATVHLTEIVGNVKKERHLCEECAQGVSTQIAKVPSPTEILTNLINQVAPGINELSKIVCPVCGLSYLEFRSHGRLGCPMDYTVFRKGLIPLLEKMHSSSQHVGKVPSRAGKEMIKKNELMQLRNELNKSIEKEDYERAAELRDKIYELSGDNNENK